MAEEKSAVDLSEAIASRLSELRREHAWRLDDVAAEVRKYGLKWDATTVTKIEQGRRQITDLAELLVLCRVFGVQLPELVAGDSLIHVTPALSLPSASIRSIVSGVKLRGVVHVGRLVIDPADETRLQAMEREARGQAEQKAATWLSRRLGREVSPMNVVESAWRLWDASLTQQRDERVAHAHGASKRSLQASRGHVTRQLLEELATSMKKEKKR